MNTNDMISGKVEKNLAFGGEGILKHNGQVVFVPFVAPEETISCNIVKLKKNFAVGELVTVEEKSDSRVAPECPYFGTCGGCQLQHLNYETQVAQKEVFVRDAFQRIGKIGGVQVSKPIRSDKQYGYRRHISLTIKKVSATSAIAGYAKTDGVTILQVEQCPIFVEKENMILKELQIYLSFFEMVDETSKVTILKNEQSQFILHFHFRELPKNAKAMIEESAKYKLFAGVIFGSKKETLSIGAKHAKSTIEDLTFTFTSDVFMQNNLQQSLYIYKKIKEIAKKSTSKDVLDLYCGIGISSLLLAKNGMNVTGVESNHRSIKMALQNAKNNKISNVKFVVGLVEDALKEITIPDFVIINPPREGLTASVIESLRKALPSRIVYISCMPSTLARDLKLLGEDNYTIEGCQPVDMFPQTTHIETVVSLVKKK